MGDEGKYDLKIADSLPVQQQDSFSDSVEQNGNFFSEFFITDSDCVHVCVCT